jgi:hypothetical protein
MMRFGHHFAEELEEMKGSNDKHVERRGTLNDFIYSMGGRLSLCKFISSKNV